MGCQRSATTAWRGAAPPPTDAGHPSASPRRVTVSATARRGAEPPGTRVGHLSASLRRVTGAAVTKTVVGALPSADRTWHEARPVARGQQAYNRGRHIANAVAWRGESPPLSAALVTRPPDRGRLPHSSACGRLSRTNRLSRTAAGVPPRGKKRRGRGVSAPMRDQQARNALAPERPEREIEET